MKEDECKIFLISDLHLDHFNIIKYCNRPFSSVREMNWFIVDNWNSIVRDDDDVYFLGDLSFGNGSRKADYWLKKLNGKIIFIKGSHDKSKGIKLFNEFILEYNYTKFLLVHDPKNVTKNWNDWVIHGHYHNHDLKNYPFINGMNRTINVSAELINYKPLNIEELFKLDFKNIKIMEKIDSKPVRYINEK